MQEEAMRERVQFVSNDTTCAAWHYPGGNGACVVMAAGLGVTKEPGTDRFAARFNRAGYSVLAFDYRHFGESGGKPRQVARIREQLADWNAAIERAHNLPGVEPAKVAIWGFSSSGGHVLRVAVRNPDVAAAIAQSPLVDGPAATRNGLRYAGLAALRLTGRGILDMLGGFAGREPLLVPLAGPPGSVAALTTPDALDGARALDPDNRYPHWQQMVAARSVLRIGSYRPGRSAGRVACPLLVVACDNDHSVLAAPAVRAAAHAPRGELLQLAGSHYAPFLAEHERTVEAEISFLDRHLLDEAHASTTDVARPDRRDARAQALTEGR
jgi:pimeloyl-ACP methyl ester carboxylesterase